MGGHIYAIELGPNVKVGRAANPERRLADHARHAASVGARVGRRWTSRMLLNPDAAEAELIARCTRFARPVQGREYFALPWDSVIAEAKSIDFDLLDSEARDKRAASESFDPAAFVRSIQAVDGIKDADFSTVASGLTTLREAVALGLSDRAREIYNELARTRTDWRHAALMAAFLGSGVDPEGLADMATMTHSVNERSLVLIDGGVS